MTNSTVEIANIGIEALDNPKEQGKKLIQIPVAEFRQLCEAVCILPELDKWLERIQASCGNPNAADGCRNILKFANECRELIKHSGKGE